jgi:hypothetical protein
MRLALLRGEGGGRNGRRDPREVKMNLKYSAFLVPMAFGVLMQAASAAPDCAAQALDQKIATADLEKFMGQCQQKAAVALCEDAATEKKLDGKARKAFVKACARDTLGK